MGKNKFLSKENLKDILPLTSTQEGILYHYLSKKGSIQYQEQLELELYGELNFEFFKKAWNYVISSNEILRTLFKWEKLESPIQIILREYTVEPFYDDLTVLSHDEAEEKLKYSREEWKSNKIKIDQETLRIRLYKKDNNLHSMFLNYHHIILDGWSTGIILKEFLDIYNRYSKGEKISMKQKVQYSDFVKFQKGVNQERDLEFWKTYLEGGEDIGLYFEKKEETEQYEEFDRICTEQMSEQLREFAKENRISISTVLYAAWGILLQRLNNTDDVIFGTTVSGRNINLQGINEIVGLCINTIPLRMNDGENIICIDLLKKLNLSLKERAIHDAVPLIKIAECSDVKKNQSLFDSIVVIENYPLDFNTNNNSILKVKDYSMREYNNFNLTLMITTFDEISVKFSFNTSAISKQLISRYAEYYINILNQILNNTEKKVSDIEFLPEEEKDKILNQFNNTSSGYRNELTLHNLFEEQVQKTPYDTAIVFKENSITYHELNVRANRLARLLREEGVKPNEIVGILLERSINMIVSILAISKAGGAYLPIDPEYPTERIQYVIEDSGTKLLISEQTVSKELNIDGKIIFLDDLQDQKDGNSNLNNINVSTDLLYVIYTSGSTGHPKGVMIEHKQIHNFMNGMEESTCITEYKTILCITTISFDIFFLEAILPLTKGMKIVIANETEQLNGKKLKELIERTGVEIIQTTPSRVQLLLEEPTFLEVLEELKVLLIGGEAITQSLLNRLLGYKSLRLYNMYGPTETTVWSTVKELTDQTITIGKPILNTRIYILDKKNRLLPIGMPGELCIAGDGLARGYYNKDDLTEQKFNTTCFIKPERIYKTGDMAKWLPNGEIEFLGRLDNQVKIRGYRIELEEIENRIYNFKTVSEVTVVDREDSFGNKFLVAFFVAEEKVNQSELRDFLSKSLLSYMIPSHFIQVDEIPLTPNGKVNRKALLFENKGGEDTYTAPETKTEIGLAQIWRKVLELEKVGIDDNFLEIGGHSLNAVKVSGSINKLFNLDLQIGDIFNYPTIRLLSGYMNSLQENKMLEIGQAAKKEYYEATPAQKRIYMSQNLDLNGIGYNMPNVIKIKGKLDREKFENAFQKIIERHEALRTSFHIVENTIMQKISEQVEFFVQYRKEENDDVKLLVNQTIKPFQLDKAPLFKAELVEIGQDNYIIFDMHHIISDGMSMEILKRDFKKYYNGEPMEQLLIHYHDYSEWYNQSLSSQRIQEQKNYWLSQLSGELPKLNLPTDYLRPPIQSFEGDIYHFTMDENQTEKIRQTALETGSSLYMVMLSACHILLAKYSNQEDIIIGSPIAGRVNEQLDDLIGMFVNLLPMRNYPKGDWEYSKFLDEVRINALNAYKNQQYQYEELLNSINMKKDISRNPLFDIMFIMQNMDREEMALNQLEIEEIRFDNKTSKYDLTFTVIEKNHKLEVEIEYATALFDKATIERMAEHFQNILNAITNNLKIKISEINMMSKQEQMLTLIHFNQTDINYTDEARIEELFERSVSRNTEKIALVCGEIQYTYKELNEKVMQWARVLKNDYGVKGADVVAVYLPRSAEMIIASLAILKAGAVCLPISRDYPLMRVNHLLKDSNAKVIITDEEIVIRKELSCSIFIFDSSKKYSYIEKDFQSDYGLDANAYLIYTSGSTGEPKGVMLNHKGIINHIHTKIKEADMNCTDICCHNLNIGFVAAIWGIYAPLFLGCTLHIYKEHEIQDTSLLFDRIETDKVSILEVVPSVVATFLELKQQTGKINNLENVRTIILTGERVSKELVHRFYSNYNIPLINAYGQSECSDDTLHYHIPSDTKIICIGKPSYNTKVYILDRYGKPQPIGIEGELCITGDGVASGYLNQPLLTKEKFVPNIFAPDQLMFRTGDTARWLPDGNVEFKGRIDHQVKIRGFRIEPEEIENTMLKIEGIAKAVVLLKDGYQEDSSLCAYFVADREITSNSVKEYLAVTLPEYMIPRYIIQVKEIPTNSNGKVNINELLKIKLDVEKVDRIEEPESAIESNLKKIWEEILSIKSVGVNDNFFELGGHSLRATILAARIENIYQKRVTLEIIFRYPTIRQLSNYIEQEQTKMSSEIKRVPQNKPYYKLSPTQKGIYVAQIHSPQNKNYNIPIVFTAKGILQKEKIEETFKKLIQRHEVFRTSFAFIEGAPMQIINDNIDFQVEYIEDDLISASNITKYIKPFVLEKAPLIRVAVIHRAEDEFTFLIDMHHIITDGVSIGIILEEFMELYKGNNLPELQVTYKDFVYWKEEQRGSQKYKDMEDYWIKQLKTQVIRKELPLDYKRPKVLTYEGDKILFRIDKKPMEQIEQLILETNCTFYIFMLSAYNILTYHYTKQDMVTVGSSVSGRNNAIFERIPGLFINLLPMRNMVRRDETMTEFIERVKHNVVEAFNNQEYPYESMVTAVEEIRDTGRNPLFDTIFDVQNMEIKPIEIEGLEIEQIDYREQYTLADLVVAIVKGEETITVNINYNTNLFKKETVDKFAKDYKKIIDCIISEPNQRVEKILNRLYKDELTEKSAYGMDKYIDSSMEDLFDL